MEHKFFQLSEIKLAPNSEKMEFTGYGAVFGNVDSYGDVIEKGAFAETLANARKTGRWPAMLSQHGGWGMTSEDLTPVGVWTEMEEDDHGLKLTGVYAPTQRGTELYKLMKMEPRPAIDGLSIGYYAEKWTNGNGKDEPRRTLHKIALIEVSPVTFPANGEALVSSVKSERSFERLLMRDAGLTRSEALVVINHGFKSLIAKRDAGGSDELQQLHEALVKRGSALAR